MRFIFKIIYLRSYFEIARFKFFGVKIVVFPPLRKNIPLGVRLSFLKSYPAQVGKTASIQ